MIRQRVNKSGTYYTLSHVLYQYGSYILQMKSVQRFSYPVFYLAMIFPGSDDLPRSAGAPIYALRECEESISD